MRRTAWTINIALLGLLGLLLSQCALDDAAPWEDPVEPFSEEAVNFLVLGDWGRNGFFRQRKVGRQMGRTAEDINSRFVVTTGDNFYETGVSSVRDGQWRRSFENIYTAPSLQTPWYPTLGNHDYLGSIEAQVAYSDVSERWTMPDLYYSLTFEIDDTTTALFLFLNTPMIVDGFADTTPDVHEPRSRAEAQLRWIDSTLAATRADWRIAVGHRSVYSAGSHHGDSQALIQHLLPRFKQYGVQVYLSGHTHSLQHLKPDDEDIHYFISGAGSAVRATGPHPAIRYGAAIAGFLSASLTPSYFGARFIDYQGRVLYDTRVERQPVPMPADEPLLAAPAF